MTPPLLALVSAVPSFCVALALIPVVRQVARSRGWYDPPDHRKLHEGQITHLGGVAMFLAVCGVVAVVGALLKLYSTRLAFLLLGGFSLSLIGLVDDLKNLRALPRLVAHLVIATIVASGGFVLRSISIPGLGTLQLGIAAYPITVIWIAGVVNAMNWADGMDGYAGGIAAFAALGMGAIGLIEGSTLTTVLSFALLGALSAFLVFNYPPARVFMGDNGATFIGFMLAVLPFLEDGDRHQGVRFTSMTVLLLVPLVDFVVTIARRILRGKSPGTPDRGHIHHRLQDTGLSPRQVLAVAYPLCAYLTLVAVAIAHPPPWMPFAVIVVGFVTTVVLAVLFAVILVVPPRRERGQPGANTTGTERRVG